LHAAPTAHVGPGQQGVKLRLTHQDDLQQFLLGGFEVGEQTNLLQHLAVEAVRLVHDQHRAPAFRMVLEQEGIERVD
jgi:hypothetical protein